MNAVAGAPNPRETSTVIGVSGMFCASCAAAVESAVARLPGVIEATAHVAADAVLVRFDEARIALTDIHSCIASLGYRTLAAGEAGAGVEYDIKFSLRLIIAAFFGMWTMLPALGIYFSAIEPGPSWWLALASGLFSVPVLTYAALPFYLAGWRSLRAGAAGIDAMVAVGVLAMVTLSIFALLDGRSEVYFDAATMLVTFQLLARVLDHRLRSKAAARTQALLTPGAGLAHRCHDATGPTAEVPSTLLRVGDLMRAGSGDELALDGRIEYGRLVVDRSRLSGEVAAIVLTTGDAVFASDSVVAGDATIKVHGIVGRRRVDQLATSVKRVLTAKPSWQRAVDRIARAFLAMALGLSLLTFAGNMFAGADFASAATHALAVFVVACPCALSLAVPIAAARTIQTAADAGVLIRDLDVVQTYARPKSLYLDKTGTVTTGRARAALITWADGTDSMEAWRLAYATSRASEHPVSRAIWAEAAGVLPYIASKGSHELVDGCGVVWSDDSRVVRLGSRDWLSSLGIVIPGADDCTSAHLAVADTWFATFAIADSIRTGVAATIESCRASGIDVSLVSGDNTAEVGRVAAVLGIEAHATQSPEQKLLRVMAARERGQKTAVCGDGSNDAPALAAADIGIAVAEGTSVAQASAGIVLLRGGAERLTDVFDFLSRAKRVIRSNFFWALAYNAVMVPAAMVGFISPELAAVAMSLSSVTVLANSARLRYVEQSNSAR